MRVIGYWRPTMTTTGKIRRLITWLAPNIDDRLPDPRTVVNPHWNPSAKETVLRYLRGANTCNSFLGYSYCRFDCGVTEHEMGCCEKTDGKWVWPEGLAHYVDKHDVDLPAEFLADIEKATSVPSITADISGMPRDLDYWIHWAKSRP